MDYPSPLSSLPASGGADMTVSSSPANGGKNKVNLEIRQICELTRLETVLNFVFYFIR
jgi:hypothetical protein